jgi:hypothetical protein
MVDFITPVHVGEEVIAACDYGLDPREETRNFLHRLQGRR